MAARSKYLTEEQHFARGYEVLPSGCWVWKTQPSARYPTFCYKSRCQAVHIVSHKIHVGEVANGVKVCHKCDVTRCVNPDHLFLGTQSDNLKDMGRKGRHGATKNPHAWAARIGMARSKPGERNPAAKLKVADVLAIRLAVKDGVKYREMAGLYHVGKSTIARIVRKKQHGGWSSV